MLAGGSLLQRGARMALDGWPGGRASAGRDTQDRAAGSKRRRFGGRNRTGV
jgi:hypothetical protein